MKTILYCLLALTVAGTPIAAQQAATDEPDIVVGALLVGSLGGGATALDERALGASHAFVSRASAKSQRLAKLLHADLVPGASVLKCGALPSSCSLGKYMRLVVIGEPQVRSDRNSALVRVRVTTVTGLPRVPLHTGETEYSLVLKRGKWIVVSEQITRTT